MRLFPLIAQAGARNMFQCCAEARLKRGVLRLIKNASEPVAARPRKTARPRSDCRFAHSRRMPPGDGIVIESEGLIRQCLQSFSQ